MFRKILHSSLIALLLYASLKSGAFAVERTSMTEARVEVLDAAFIIELDRIGEFAALLCDGLCVWFDALPSFVGDAFDDMLSSLRTLIDDGYAPACTLCQAVISDCCR